MIIICLIIERVDEVVLVLIIIYLIYCQKIVVHLVLIDVCIREFHFSGRWQQ